MLESISKPNPGQPINSLGHREPHKSLRKGKKRKKKKKKKKREKETEQQENRVDKSVRKIAKTQRRE